MILPLKVLHYSGRGKRLETTLAHHHQIEKNSLKARISNAVA